MGVGSLAKVSRALTALQRTSICISAIAVASLAQGQPGSSAAEPESGKVIEQVVVTARRREQPSQDVPISLTVLNSRMLEEAGLGELKALNDEVPGISLETAQSYQRVSLKLRGVGTIGNSRSFEGAVGVFVDGVYRPRTGMVLGDLLDVGRMEILRGPQSTLFGKNTVAGAVSVWSTKPSFDEASGELELRVASEDTRYMSGSYNQPIDENSAIRIAANLHRADGFFESPDGGRYEQVDRHAVKLQYLIQPTPDLEVHVIADSARSDANCCWASGIVQNGPTVPLVQLYSELNGLPFFAAPEAESGRLESTNLLADETIEDDGLMARVVWDMPSFTLTSTTSIRGWEHAQLHADADYTGASLFVLTEPSDIDTRSQEISALLPIGRTELLVGAYLEEEEFSSLRSAETGSDADNYLNALISAAFGASMCVPPVIEDDCLFPTDVGALLPTGEFTRESYVQTARAADLFAHASIPLSERVEMDVGLRYSSVSKRGGVDNLYWYDSAIARQTLATLGVPDDGTPRNGLDLAGTVYGPSFQARYRNSTSTGLLSFQFRPKEDWLLYGGYHRGYKAGGVNLFREGALTTTTYAPEYANGLEVGVKTDILDGRGRVNLALFDTRFSDLQMNFFTGLEFRTLNAGKTRSRGIELQSAFQLTDSLSLDFSATDLDAEFGDLVDPALNYLDYRDLPRAPRLSAVAGLRYEHHLGSYLMFRVRAVTSYASSQFAGTEVANEQKIDSHTLHDLDFAIGDEGGRWEAVLWCKNCGDRTYRTLLFNSVFQDGSYSAYLNPARMVGLTVRVGI
jgi:outer membrane receptor protein involved in Fe transport